ncbi:MAG: MFS transporter [Euryarchaeota archaeon]|nr:MFS transporter [Euryarchaeota archaeon]
MKKDRMFYRFAIYGFLKNLKFFDPFLILFFIETGISFLQIGVLIAVRSMATNILEIPTGIYADAFGRRKSMVMSFISYIGSFLVFYAFPNYYLFMAAMVLFGLGGAFRSGTHKAMILEYLRINDMTDKKVEYYGSTRSASELGAAVSSLIAAGLVFYSGSYRYVFLASILPYSIDLVNLATYPAELDGEIVRVKKNMKRQLKDTLKDFVGIFKNLFAMKAILSSAVFKAYFKITKEYLQPILKVFALSLPLFVALEETKRVSVVVGVVYCGIYLLTSYTSKNSARVTARFGDLAGAVNMTYIAGGILLLIAGVSTKYGLESIAIVVFLLFYMLYNVRRPMTVSFVSDQISHRTMASGLSVESQATTISQTIIAVGIGVLADAFGVGIALFVIGIAMVVIYPLLRVKNR